MSTIVEKIETAEEINETEETGGFVFFRSFKECVESLPEEQGNKLGGRPKSADYVKLAEEHFKNGKSISQIAVAYSVSERTVQRALAKYQTEGSQINDESSVSEEHNESSVPKQSSPLNRFYNDNPVEETNKNSSNSYYYDGDLDSNAKSKATNRGSFFDDDDDDDFFKSFNKEMSNKRKPMPAPDPAPAPDPFFDD